MVEAKVDGLFVSEGSMRPMIGKQSVVLVRGVGIDGDRYATGNGTYQAFKEPGRQLTVISGDSAHASMCGLPRSPKGGVGDLRRNVVVTGMTASELSDAIGSNLKLGECVVLVHRRCVPCMYNERLNRSPGLMEATWEAGGVNCEILRGGNLAVGDAVEVEAGSYREGRADDGGKKAAFYKRPSLRTREEARSLAQVPKDKHKPGVDRILTAYATVGAGDAIGMSAQEAAEQIERGRRRAGSRGGGSSPSSSSGNFLVKLVVQRRRLLLAFFFFAAVVFAACSIIAEKNNATEL